MRETLAVFRREFAAYFATPLAYVFNSVNPILAQGAAFGEMTMVDRFEAGDVTKLFRTGDELLIDPELGNVTIVKRAPEHS